MRVCRRLPSVPLPSNRTRRATPPMRRATPLPTDLPTDLPTGCAQWPCGLPNHAPNCPQQRLRRALPHPNRSVAVRGFQPLSGLMCAASPQVVDCLETIALDNPCRRAIFLSIGCLRPLLQDYCPCPTRQPRPSAPNGAMASTTAWPSERSQPSRLSGASC